MLRLIEYVLACLSLTSTLAVSIHDYITKHQVWGFRVYEGQEVRWTQDSVPVLRRQTSNIVHKQPTIDLQVAFYPRQHLEAHELVSRRLGGLDDPALPYSAPLLRDHDESVDEDEDDDDVSEDAIPSQEEGLETINDAADDNDEDDSSLLPDPQHIPPGFVDLDTQALDACLFIPIRPPRRSNSLRQSLFTDVEVAINQTVGNDPVNPEPAESNPADEFYDPYLTCTEAFKQVRDTNDILVCGAVLRIPKAESWDYWRTLERRDNSSGTRVWQTMDLQELKASLLDIPKKSLYLLEQGHEVQIKSVFQRDPFFIDGTRKSYLEFDIRTHLPKLYAWSQDKTSGNLDLCFTTRLTDGHFNPEYGVIKAGEITKSTPPETGRSMPPVDTSMRVFFDPGWRLDTTVLGNHLSYQDRLSVKLNGCGGKMDDLAIRTALPSRWYVRRTDPATHVGYNVLKSLFTPSRLYPQALQFSIKVDALKEVDATPDWRRAAFLVRKLERKAAMLKRLATSKPENGTTVTTKKPRVIRGGPPDDHLKMYLCLYADPSEHFGLPVGSTQFALASSDAAEFVAISILILLGLPVSCMWTLGCLGYKHKKLRQDLRRMRLVQQRDQIENRLAGYLGFDRKVTLQGDSSDDEEIDEVQDQTPQPGGNVHYSRLEGLPTPSLPLSPVTDGQTTSDGPLLEPPP